MSNQWIDREIAEYSKRLANIPEKILSLHRHASDEIRLQSVGIFEGLGEPEGIKFLRALSSDKSKDIRENANKALRRLGDEVAIAAEKRQDEARIQRENERLKKLEAELKKLAALDDGELLGMLKRNQPGDVKNIGELLNRRGGMKEMRRIYTEYDGNKRLLEMNWNGIGEWRG